MVKASKSAVPIVTKGMLVTFVLLLSLPLWVKEVGLYQYLGVEIVIWMIFALGFNLLLGYSGLPSFGHGAYFGIGAYGFGLAQLGLFENLWFGLLAAVAAASLAGAIVAAFVSHRRGIYFALLAKQFPLHFEIFLGQDEVELIGVWIQSKSNLAISPGWPALFQDQGVLGREPP